MPRCVQVQEKNKSRIKSQLYRDIISSISSNVRKKRQNSESWVVGLAIQLADRKLIQKLCKFKSNLESSALYE